MDSALDSGTAQFFIGWTEQDYTDALAWAQGCANFGWHIPGKPRLPLLQAQHDRAFAAAPAVGPPASNSPPPLAGAGAPLPTSESPAPPPGQSPDAPPAGTAGTAADAGAAADGVAAAAGATAGAVADGSDAAAAAGPGPNAAGAAMGPDAPPPTAEPPVQSANLAPGVPLDAPTTEIAPMVPGAAGAGAGTAAIGVVAVPPSRRDAAPEPLPDGPLTDKYLDQHFHREAVWVAQRAHLDIGAETAAGWSSSGTPTQVTNRLTADRVVLFCSRKMNAGENDSRPLLWDWRRCETEEASAYGRLVAQNEFPAAGRGVLLGCAGVDSYVYLERCVQTMAEDARP